jgi:hypothetical protein
VAKQSTVAKMDPRIREAVDKAIRENRLSIDEIVELIVNAGGKASRSAVGRYVQNSKKRMDEWQKTQEIAKTWAKSFQEDPNGEVGTLVSQVLLNLAYKTVDSISDREAAPKAVEVMMLGKGLKEILGAQKISLERTLKIQEEAKRQAATAAKASAKLAGVSAEVIEQIERDILKQH